jgi:aminomethyltransferase
MSDALKRTPLFDEHVRLGGKIVPFAGFEMPVQYPAGIIAEHQAVRRAAGMFDVSHMGELEASGGDALGFVQFVTTNDASRIEVGQAQYTTICREDGGILDDCIVYRFPDRYMLVVNASNADRDRDWIAQYADRFGTTLVDRSAETGLIALQGPAAQSILARLTEAALEDINYYHFGEGTVAGVDAVISRTGYTGEDGFELYLPADGTVHVWQQLLDAGAADGLVPAGLGARDSLRLEMGYALYGNDMDETRTPLEAGLGWVTKLDKGEFIGRDALVKQKETGVTERLAGFICSERGFPRHGYEVHVAGSRVGIVTSGGVSPMLQQGVGMCYVQVAHAKAGSKVDIMIRDKAVPAEIVRPPFYRDGSIRK